MKRLLILATLAASLAVPASVSAFDFPARGVINPPPSETCHRVIRGLVYPRRCIFPPRGLPPIQYGFDEVVVPLR